MTAAQSATADPGTRLVEEIKLLLEAVADRAGPWLDRLATSTHDQHETDRFSRGWCPFCTVVALVRGEPSELAGAMLDRAAELVALLRAVLADRWEPGTLHMPGFRPAGAAPTDRFPGTDEPQPPPRPATPVRRVPVQKIPVRRTDRPQDEG